MNSNDEYYDNTIKEQYKFIVDTLRGGRIFGEQIDFTNYMQVVVAAYYLGTAKQFFDPMYDFLKEKRNDE